MAPGERGKSDARYFWLTGRRSTLLRVEKLAVFGIGILLNIAAVPPLPLILIVVLRRASLCG